MRPIKLEMHAFGPYARSQTLDFRELADRPLFLIHGPTGAGKSSILDAICFALYGESSGDERDGSQMRSDYAHPEQPTRVVYEFALGDSVYRIQRSPTQDVQRRDGKGLRNVPQKVEMWECHEPGVPGDLIASKVGDVAEQVQRLLGLRADQFRQVVVLPQGRFRELLTASSGEREKIFSTLFQTHHYRAIQDRLKERARTIRQGLDEQYNQQQLVLSNAEAESREALAAKIGDVTKEIADLTERRKHQEKAVEAARTAVEQARETDRKLRDVERAQNALNELLSRSEEIDQHRTSLERAKKAATLTDAETNLNARIDEAVSSEKERDRLQGVLIEAEQKLARAEQEKQHADALQPQLEGQTQKQRDLEALRPRLSALAEAEQQLIEARTAAQELAQQHASLEAERATLTEQLEQTQQRLQTARLQAGQVQVHESNRNNLSRLVRQRSQLDTERANLQAETESQSKATAALETAYARLSYAQREFDRLEEAWRNSQAAILAGQLELEKPCPVCGSIHHPSPAMSDDHTPDEAELERARSEVESARHNRDQANNNKITIDGRVQTLSERIAELEDELGELADAPVDDLRKQRSEVEEVLRIARDESEQVVKLKDQVDTLYSRLEELASQVGDAQRALDDARRTETVATTRVEAAAGEVPEEYRSLSALDAALDVTKQQIEELTDRIERAKSDLETATRACQQASAELEAARKEAEADRKRADEASSAFARRRLEQDFQSHEEYRAALLSAERIDQLDTQIKQYDEQVSNARFQLNTAQKHAQGLQQPDLEMLESALKMNDEELKNIIQELAAKDSQLKNLQRAASQLEDIAEQTTELDRQYQVAEYLAGVAGGDSAYNTYRVSFERFVLSAFLDEVLDYATRRLYQMTNGRFQLVRKSEGGDRRRGSGLDLEVEDTYTGTARDVKTLSGGEGFLAALAMALGLSEVVQNRAGGIRLQTLFVDEGFGSLDPDALDRSLTTLVELHHGRLVGIISHVPELQERIDAKLTVEAGRDGSRARFVM